MNFNQAQRVREICLALPETTEKLSHGEPTFFVHNKVYVMFANNHHGDGHIAVWLPVPPGLQSSLIAAEPTIYFYPPYVGVRGWVGIELANITDADLTYHIQVAWELIAPKRLRKNSASISTSAVRSTSKQEIYGGTMAATKKRFIQKAIKKPGALHKQLGVPEGETIPKSKLKAAAKKGNTKVAKRARLALTLEKMPHRGRKSAAKKSGATKSTAKKTGARKKSAAKS